MKKVSLLLILALSAIAISAQERGVSAEAGRKATFARNGFWDNWFIGAGAGANMYFGSAQDSHADLLDRPTLTGNGQIGKWFNPYMGARLKGTYGSIHTFVNNAKTMNTQHALTGEVDFLFNASDYFCNYNEHRLYSFIPYVGVGAAIARGYSRVSYYSSGSMRHHEKTLTFNAGLINRFRLTNRLDLDIELSASLLNDNFDRRKSSRWAYNGLANASANLVYKIGSTTDFTEAVLMDQGLLDDLNRQINSLKQENDALMKRPMDCPKCPDAKEIIKTVVENGLGATAVSFRKGSSVIDNAQEANLFHIAQYLKDNPQAKVKITGYADRKTGNKSINERLSEQRAKNVANELMKKHNISSNRITTDWKGDTEQPFPSNNDWNRVAIVVSHK